MAGIEYLTSLKTHNAAERFDRIGLTRALER